MEPNKEQIKTVKKLMVDKGVRFAVRLLPEISERVGKPIHKNTLYNVLSGYRATGTEQEVLDGLRSILVEMPDQ